MPFPLSATIITLNEEDNLERTLAALGFINDIVIVDSGSTDRTLRIAEQYKTRVFHREFDNYASQKNFALEQTKNDWVLALDADEVVSPALRLEIESLFQNPNKIPPNEGYLIPRLTWYLGKWIKFGGFYPNYQTRLFPKSKGKFSGGLVHERVVLPTPPKKLMHPLYHFSYQNISDHLSFIDRYSSLFAEEEFRKGKKSSIGWAFAKGCFKAFYMYFVRLGALDGKQGFVLATLGFYYNFLKYLKLFEKHQKLSVSPFLVMVDPIHNIESDKTTQKNRDKIHIR
ncbi:glycosyltransferase family 2 protein [Leptospira ognonensis]|uniref:Glycosyltransferase family 2 protein n=1 Tax=Leptospira ognonensis TaxID=2484945 RepID=A0A4R9JX98_9LEPT|nr:glycosyltransferase family 2 protein [Leptospira ognonensis]TGL57092.1 glycosyltransferase family 2 protein [Leptospira ognonensis]